MIQERITNGLAVAASPSFLWLPQVDTALSIVLSVMGIAWLGLQIFYKIRDHNKPPS